MRAIVKSVRTFFVVLGVCGLAAAAAAQPSNDRCPNAIVITPDMEFTGSNIGATSDLAGTSCAEFFDPFDIWFRFTAPASGTYFFDTLGANFDTTLAAYNQCSGNGATGLITCNDDEPGGDLWSEISVDMVTGQSVVLRVAGFAGDEGIYSIFATPPTPQGGVCCLGVTCATNATPASCAGVNRVFVATATCNASGNSITPCCRADFNKQGGIGVQDVFDFLTAWFSGDVSADWAGNGSQTPGVQSIFDYLAAWFSGGC